MRDVARITTTKVVSISYLPRLPFLEKKKKLKIFFMSSLSFLRDLSMHAMFSSP